MKPFESTEKVTESFDAVCQDDESICINEAVSNEKESLAKQFLNSLKLFQNVSFCLFCVNNLLFFAAMTILWVHLNGYIIKNNFGDSAEAGLVYSVIGISNVFGRIFLGLFCDHDKVNPIVVYAFGNFLLALNELYASFAQSFGGTFSFLFRYCFCYLILFPISCDRDKRDIWFHILCWRSITSLHYYRVSGRGQSSCWLRLLANLWRHRIISGATFGRSFIQLDKDLWLCLLLICIALFYGRFCHVSANFEVSQIVSISVIQQVNVINRNSDICWSRRRLKLFDSSPPILSFMHFYVLYSFNKL